MDRNAPASPLVLDARNVGRRPGSMHEMDLQADAPADFGTDVMSVPQGQTMDLRVRMESVHEGVLVTGTVSARAVGACVRCLDDIDHAVNNHFQELFVWPDRAKHHREVAAEADEEEEHQIVDEQIDLETVLRDAVLPSLPFQPVCRQDCPGLCSECGARLEDDPDHHHELLDPRWAALEALAPLATSSGDVDNEEKRN